MTGPFGETSVSWGSLRKMADDATKPLPDDWYNVVVVKAEGKIASTGSNMVSTTLEVVDGPHKSRRLFTNFVLTPENGFALGIFFRNMAAFGIDDAFFQTIAQYPLETGMSMIAQAIQGRQVKVEVGTRQWQGQNRNECRSFASLAGFGPLAPNAVSGPVMVPGTPGVPVTSSQHVPGVMIPTTPTAPTIPGNPTPVPTATPTPMATPASVPESTPLPATPAVPGPPPPQPAF